MGDSLRLLLAAVPLLLACDPPAPRQTDSSMPPPPFLHGLRTAKYTATDLARAKAWYAEVVGGPPYFDEPFYVGFRVGGFELGIVPDSGARGSRTEAGVAYWGVSSADEAWARLIALGATPHEAVQDVGEGIRIGSVHDPFGNILGIIENRQFRATPLGAGHADDR